MVRGIAYSNVCQSFFSPSARTQFLFSLPPFARPFTALLLIECLRGRCLCVIIRQSRSTLSFYMCGPLSAYLLCLSAFIFDNPNFF